MSLSSDLLGQTTGWIEQNQGLLIQYGVNIVAALLVLIIGLFAASLISRGVGRVMVKRRVDQTIVDFISGLLKYLLIIVVVIAALSRVGVQTASVIAILGAAGLAVGLALKNSLSNFASGILLIMFRPFKNGDYVEAGGSSGTVTHIKIFSTILTMPDNKEVTLPNSSVMGGKIINYSKNPTRRIDLVIGVSYDADLRQTRDILQRVIDAESRILPEPAPLIAVNALGDSSVNFIVRPWVNRADHFSVHNQLLEEIKIALDAANIGIPYPQMDVHLHKEQ
ncbi:small-conductance mechanosensitive channel MscS [Dongshaea marina]|uniref:small-conductance mechanosensitive channel MscS n=1 Tax=Dongshaea marina TaxID=2047966 RepID=UPI000D3E9F7F|nr:small-conductance mechanosensitive channel MscS [Dongshaea marina]